MKIIKYKINFKDKRGSIIDMIENENINAVTLIQTKKSSIRGNHYHKKTCQWNYILNGKVKVIVKKTGSPKKKYFLKKGDLFMLPPKEQHSFIGLTNYSMLVFTKGPRGGKEYESDTFRLNKNLI